MFSLSSATRVKSDNKKKNAISFREEEVNVQLDLKAFKKSPMHLNSHRHNGH